MDAKLRQFISRVKKEHDDDAVDRCIYANTVYILGFFAVLIMAKQYVGDPLQCWLPAEYTGAWEKYIENYCFVENTYYVAENQSSRMLSPENRWIRRQYQLRYYQWIPYILSIQALLCFAPKMVFKILYSFSDMRINDLVQLAYKETKKKGWNNSGDAADDAMTLPKRIADRFIARRRAKALISFNWYLTGIYMLMKLLLICAIVLQLVIINFFLGTWDPLWGFNIVWQLVINGVDWRNNGFFPRVTFCDLQTRDLGQFREHTVQCVLMINMFAEKIFIFLWLWFFALFFIAILNLFFWLYRILSMQSKQRMVTDALRLYNLQPQREIVQTFIQEFLRMDGVLVLRLIDSNSGYIHMSEILHQLWFNFNAKEIDMARDYDDIKPSGFEKRRGANNVDLEDIDADE